MFRLPGYVIAIISDLENAGHEAFIVGGCVRDMIRGAAPKDWDVTTSALPHEVKALFLRTFDTGIKHGTVSVLVGGNCVEVTTYRIDGEYIDNRRPQSVTFSQKIEEDLSRRDFTVNAIAYSPTRGFVDPFGGREDIAREVIRCVGCAETRFGEDALRMLRAVRFASVLGFEPVSDTKHFAKKLRANLAHISAERVREELVKLLCGKNIGALSLLEETGQMEFVLQGRKYPGDLQETIEWLRPSPTDENMRLALFLARAGDECANILRDLRFDNKTIRTVSTYVALIFSPLSQNRYEIKKILRKVSPEDFEKILDLKKIACPSPETESLRTEARDILAKGECFTLRQLAVNGNDLAAAGVPHGKETGAALERLLDEVMREPNLNTKEQLLCRL